MLRHLRERAEVCFGNKDLQDRPHRAGDGLGGRARGHEALRKEGWPGGGPDRLGALSGRGGARDGAPGGGSALVAVCDFGGGTLDATVVQRDGY